MESSPNPQNPHVRSLGPDDNRYWNASEEERLELLQTRLHEFHPIDRMKVIGNRFGVNSNQWAASAITVVLHRTLGEIFIDQHKNPGRLSWRDLNANRVARLNKLITALSQRYPQYSKTLDKFAKSADVTAEGSMKYFSGKLIDSAIEDYREGRTVLLASMGDFFGNPSGKPPIRRLEPDLRVIEPDKNSMQLTNDIHSRVKKIAGIKKAPEVTGIIGELLVASGQNLASITSGEALGNKAYVICPNVIKGLDRSQEIASELKVKLSPDQARKIVTLLYIAHEYGHLLSRFGTQISEETRTDRWAVAAVFDAVLSGDDLYKDISPEQVIAVTFSEYGKAVFDGEKEKNNEQGYYIAGSWVMNTLAQSRCIEFVEGRIRLNASNIPAFIGKVSKIEGVNLRQVRADQVVSSMVQLPRIAQVMADQANQN